MRAIAILWPIDSDAWDVRAVPGMTAAGWFCTRCIMPQTRVCHLIQVMVQRALTCACALAAELHVPCGCVVTDRRAARLLEVDLRLAVSSTSQVEYFTTYFPSSNVQRNASRTINQHNMQDWAASCMARHGAMSSTKHRPMIAVCIAPAASLLHSFPLLCATAFKNVLTAVVYSAGWRRRCAQWLDCCQRCTVTARPLHTTGHGLVHTMGLSQLQGQCTDRLAGDMSVVHSIMLGADTALTSKRTATSCAL